MKAAALFILSLAFGAMAMAQPPCDPNRQGKLTVLANPRLETILHANIGINPEDVQLNGWRVQAYAGDRIEANQLRNALREMDPNLPIYYIYENPYFKVRVGDYRTRFEALEMYYRLKADPRFEGALMIPGKINFPPLQK